MMLEYIHMKNEDNTRSEAKIRERLSLRKSNCDDSLFMLKITMLEKYNAQSAVFEVGRIIPAAGKTSRNV